MSTYYFEYDATNKIIATRFEDELTDEIFRAYYAAAPSYIGARDVQAGIVDFTKVNSFKISTSAIRQMATLMPLLADPKPRFVIAPGEVAFGLARMFVLSGPGRDAVRVVRLAEEAYAALGVKEPHFERLP